MARRKIQPVTLPENVVSLAAVREKAEQQSAEQKTDARILLAMRRLSREIADSGLRDSAMDAMDALSSEYFFDRGGRL